MSDQWDFYFARINDAPASIFIDLGIRADVPLEKRPWLLWVWVQLRAPKPDGLATNEEAAQLNSIGEALEAVISATCGAQLVARVTGLTAIEFAVENESVSDEESGDLRYQLVVSRTDSVDSHSINGITIELARLAREHDGAYEGWDCAVARGEALQ